MKTKKYTLYVLTFLLTAGATFSCKDFLNVKPVSSFGPDYVFKDVDNATKAVYSAYAAAGGDNGYGIRLTMYYPYDNDEMMGQGGTPYPDNERRDIGHYSVQPSNTQLATPFNQLFLGIERANICIYYIPKMAQYTSGTADEQAALKRLHGEALTLRAQFYYELIRNWGDVPAQFEPAAFIPNLFLPKTDRNILYDHILADLADASALVPYRSQVAEEERITQGAVRALRARIALARGGYSLVGSTMVRDPNYKAFYQIARDECNAIMLSNEHHLNPSFKAVFKDAITAHALEPNGEILFQFGMTGGTSGTGDSKLAYYNGPRINGNGNGALTILPTYFYLFDKLDSRRDVTCAPYDVTNGLVVARPLVSMVDGKFRRDWISPAPSPTSTQQYFGLSWPVIRYSDVLLMFAEAENEIAGAATGLAVAAFNQVRLRAFGGNAAAAGTATLPLDYTGFFNAIVNERALEFGGEGIRKYDLIRWNMLASRLAATKTDLNNLALGTGTFTVATLPPSTIGITTGVGSAGIPPVIYIDQTVAPYGPSSGALGLTYLGGSSPYQQVAAPGGTPTVVTWRGYPVTTPQTLTPVTGIPVTLQPFYAEAFKPNKSELLPMATSVLDANPSLVQNTGF